MAIGIEKLYGDLTTRPAPPFKRDCGLPFAQPLAHWKDLLDRPDLESDVMQLRMARWPRASADQRNRMMIGMAAQKCKAAGLQLFRIDLGQFKAKTCV